MPTVVLDVFVTVYHYGAQEGRADRHVASLVLGLVILLWPRRQQ